MSPRRVLAGVIIVLVGGVAVWRLSSSASPSSGARSTSSASTTTTDEAPREATPKANAPSASATANTAGTQAETPPPKLDAKARAERSTPELLDALGSKDDFVVVDALDDLVERKETRALSKLTAFDIKN